MNEAMFYFILVVALAILVPVLFSYIRERDFKRQVKGKRPERTLKADEKISYDKSAASNREIDAIGTAGITNVRANGQKFR